MPSENVLIVDDEAGVREIVESILSDAGYSCHGCSSGAEALTALASGTDFALIVSDLMMPDLDGIGLLKHTRQNYPDIPVVLVTAVDDIATALNAIRQGAYDYLLKPFHREALLASVGRALDHRRLKLQNRNYQTMLETQVAARTQQLRSAIAELERSYDITLEALGAALDLRDAETEGHSQRVTAYTSTLARAMSLPESQIRVIARGAFLHDIGKIAIPDSILLKPGPLTPEENACMREHCVIGYRMLAKIPFLTETAEIVYAHQERFDGSGYPRGLAGDVIPLGARIFAIADTYDAMTSDRPYRAALSSAAAREEVERWSGRQFDPEIAAIFLRMPDDIWKTLRQKSLAATPMSLLFRGLVADPSAIPPRAMSAAAAR